ncbi:ArsR/SmtB family transcription factor [Pirellulaceae bacterium SH467]
MNTPPMITWMQSLSDPIRARLLRLLDRSELTVAELCTTLQLPQSTVSRHLKVLVDEGWIASRRDGTSNLYRMRSSEIDAGQKKLWQVVKLQSVLESTAEQDDARLEQVIEARRSRSQAFFSSSAEKWDRMRSDLFGTRLDAFVLAAAADPDHIVGDLGCGTGAFSHFIAPWVRKVFAIDGSSTMLQSARKRLKDFSNVEVRKGELSHLPLDDESLSMGVMALVLPYLPNPLDALREAHRVVQAQGQLILLDMLPHDRSEYREQMGHQWLGFSEQQMGAWLDDSGWSLVRFLPLPPDPEAKGTGLFLVKATRNR